MPHTRFAVPLGVNSALSAEPVGNDDRGACSGKPACQNLRAQLSAAYLFGFSFAVVKNPGLDSELLVGLYRRSWEARNCALQSRQFALAYIGADGSLSWAF